MFKLFLFSIGLPFLLISTAQAEPTQDDLQRIEAELRQERKTQKEAEKKSAEIADEIKTVQKQMVRSAKAVREKEDLLNDLKRKLADLQKKEADLNQKLALSDKQMVEVSTGLQTLALRPPEVVLLEPQSPLEHLRSKMLFNFALPQVKSMNEGFLHDLSQLALTKKQIENQAKRAKTTQAQLNERASQMNKLIKQKELLQAQYDATHKKSRQRIVSLANQAKDLKELLERLEAEKQRQEAEKAKREAEQRTERQSIVQAQNEPPQSLSIPKGSFKKAKGSLSYPINGRIVESFNDINSAGLHSKGMRLAGTGGSIVTNIFYGTVLFSGPFKSYGQLLIVDNGDDYLTLLTGLEEMNVSEGQEILAGEPVGRLNKNGELYLEIRKNGQPIDPKPWFR